MESFEHSQQYQQIDAYYSSIQQQPVKVRQAELPLLEAFISSPQFNKICSAFNSIEEYYGQQLQTASKSDVQIQILEIESRRTDDQLMKDKTEQGIQKLRQSIFSLQEYNTLILQKHDWLMQEICRYQQALPDIKDEIQITQSQNQKIKASGKVSPASTNNDKSLQSLLKNYNCEGRTFPRNKTETLMLINHIQSMIQQLEMKKLQSYMISP